MNETCGTCGLSFSGMMWEICMCDLDFVEGMSYCGEHAGRRPQVAAGEARQLGA